MVVFNVTRSKVGRPPFKLIEEFAGIFPKNIYEDIETTFLVGEAIKVSPVLNSTKDGDPFTTYFPPGEWVDLDTFDVLKVTEPDGALVNLNSTISVKKHLRPGHIVPIQANFDGTADPANSTDALQTYEINLLINRDETGFAKGSLFIDGGQNMTEINKKTYELYEFKYLNKSI